MHIVTLSRDRPRQRTTREGDVVPMLIDGETAGPELKGGTLELGGSDPVIVCPDANLKRAIETRSLARELARRGDRAANGTSCGLGSSV